MVFKLFFLHCATAAVVTLGVCFGLQILQSVEYPEVIFAPSYDGINFIYFLTFVKSINISGIGYFPSIGQVYQYNIASHEKSTIVESFLIEYDSISVYSIGHYHGDIYFFAGLSTLFKFNAKWHQVTQLNNTSLEVNRMSTLVIFDSKVFLIAKEPTLSPKYAFFYFSLTENETVKVLDLPDEQWTRILLMCNDNRTFYLFGTESSKIFKIKYNSKIPIQSTIEVMQTTMWLGESAFYNFMQIKNFLVYVDRIAITTIDVKIDAIIYDTVDFAGENINLNVSSLVYTEENMLMKYFFVILTDGEKSIIRQVELCNRTAFTPEKTSAMTINEYTPFELRCDVTDIPKPIVTWKKPYGKTDLMEPNLDGSLRQLLPLHQHSGIYSCHAEGICGLETRSINVTIKDRIDGVIRTKISLSADIGETVDLNCTGMTYAYQNLGWLKDNSTLTVNLMTMDHGNSRITLTEDVELQISSVNESDAGVYTCLFKDDYDKNIIYATEYNLTINTKDTITAQFGGFDSSSPFKPISVATGLGLGLFVLISVYLYYNYKKAIVIATLTPEEIRDFRIGRKVSDNHGSNNLEEVTYGQPYDKSLEIPPHSFEINREITLGEGQFATVCKGVVKLGDKLVDAAFKTLKSDNNDREAERAQLKSLLSELKLMSYIGQHKNVVHLLGAYTRELEKGKIYIALEFCANGSLERLLQSDTHSIQTLCEWSLQIARGMEHLSSLKVIHADLATRNVLVTLDLTIRISDFGLSRRLENYSVYVKEGKEPLPWRWMAVEALDGKNFSTQSDVWSYGVTLWEIFSSGEVPYLHDRYSPEFISQLKAGRKLLKPLRASEQIYCKLLECWSIIPAERPLFSELAMSFQELCYKQQNIQYI